LVLSGVANNLPTKLDHRIHFGIAGDSQDTVVRYPGTPVHKDVVHLRPPLRGDSWVALEGPGGNNHHTAGILQFEGRNLVPQRFAIDFARSYDDGQLFHDDREDVHSYRGYGAEVLAVADGRVVFVRDDVPDNTGQAKANREWLRIHDLCRSEVPALAWYKGVIARRWAQAANLEWSSRCPVALVDPRLTQHLEGNDRRPNKREFLYAAI
jgi:hypothetical protein